MRHIAAHVRPGGLFITSALRRSAGYRVGDRWFPSANVDERDLQAVLAGEFDDATVEARELAEHESQGYSGIVLASARRVR